MRHVKLHAIVQREAGYVVIEADIGVSDREVTGGDLCFVCYVNSLVKQRGLRTATKRHRSSDLSRVVLVVLLDGCSDDVGGSEAIEIDCCTNTTESVN